jgi:hypothetical protein
LQDSTFEKRDSTSFPTSEFDELIRAERSNPEIITKKISIMDVSQDIELNEMENYFSPDEEYNISEDKRNEIGSRMSAIQSFGGFNLISSNTSLKEGGIVNKESPTKF